MKQLNKSLTTVQGIGVLTSTLLGSGIFIIPAIIATVSHETSVLAWIIIMVFMIPVAYIFGELGSIYPNASGTAYFVEKAFGSKAGKIIALMYLSVIPIGPPVVIITGATYLGAIFDCNYLGIGAICFITLIIMFIINTFGIEISSKTQTGIAIISMIIFSLVIISGMYRIFRYDVMCKPFVFQYAGIEKLGNSISIAFWCFVGIEAVAHLAAEFKDVKRDFSKVIILSVLIVGIVYILIGYVILRFGAFGNEEINNNSLVILSKILFSSYGKYLMAIIGFLTCFSAVNLYLVSSSRLIYSLNINKKLSTTNERGIPICALLLTFAAVAVTTFVKIVCKIDLSVLVFYANGIFVLIYISAMLSGAKLFKSFKRILAIIATLFCTYILFCMGKNIIYALIIISVLAIKEYVLVNKK
ncbi:L-methionine/branched-chain amino acid transporter [Clostridium sp. ZS2-4]|uniref:L-methionine/branched-chain amino acid transporter n=1 Tax=Clostridium sp. ZS2-4 TaxID=2987703 RepID=UPI00227BEA70|nr:L-methionine/branched-chain amino acid transporter [Clostridium sp. ZS2-4]MCY6355325.1 L-methionine/branched-chain amino acid transporter [Clostridium sp. ZS2-4]